MEMNSEVKSISQISHIGQEKFDLDREYRILSNKIVNNAQKTEKTRNRK